MGNLETVLLNVTYISFFLFDLITNKARKLKVAESNSIVDNIPSSLSLCRLGLLSFSFSFMFYLSQTMSLSLSILFVDAALQLLLCRVMSSSIIRINTESINLNLNTYCSRNYLKINVNKTKCIKFRRGSRRRDYFKC